MSHSESVTPVVIRGIPVTLSDHQQKSANNIFTTSSNQRLISAFEVQ